MLGGEPQQSTGGRRGGADGAEGAGQGDDQPDDGDGGGVRKRGRNEEDIWGLGSNKTDRERKRGRS